MKSNTSSSQQCFLRKFGEGFTFNVALEVATPLHAFPSACSPLCPHPLKYFVYC